MVECRSPSFPAAGIVLALALCLAASVLLGSCVPFVVGVFGLLVPKILGSGSAKTHLSFGTEGLVFRTPVSTQLMRYRDVTNVRLRGNALVGKEVHLRGRCDVDLSESRVLVRDGMALPDTFVKPIEEVFDEIRKRVNG